MIFLAKVSSVSLASMVTATQHHDGFLAFLRWLKIYLGGQTGQKIDPALASQAAVVQGFGTFQQPDLILHEDRLAEGLAFAAADLGLEAPDLRRADPPALPFTLEEIWSRDVEDAAREAYQRDILGYGFGRWRR